MSTVLTGVRSVVAALVTEVVALREQDGNTQACMAGGIAEAHYRVILTPSLLRSGHA